MNRIKNVLCFFFVILALSGCMNKNVEIKQNEDEPVPIGKPVSGGELSIPVIQFDTLNPILNDNKSIYYLDQLIYEGLIRLDENLNAQPALAESWNVSADGLEWTFKLRDDVVWHDGKVFTSEDVKFTVDSIKMNTSGKEPIYSEYVKHIKNIKILSQNTITVKFDTGINSGIELFTFPIIPKHQFESKTRVYDGVDIKPIGTGPYKVESYNKFKDIKLVVNDSYWGDKPYITSIIAKRVPDKEGALTSVEVGEVDVAPATNFDWEKYSGDKSLSIYEYVTKDYEFLGFNFRNKIIQDKNVRKALGYSIDRHAIINEVYLGHATVVDVPIYPDSYLYDEEEKKFGKDLLVAKKLLAESGWENRDDDKWLENELGQELRLNFLVNEDNPQRMRVSQMLSNQLEEIGVDIVINKMNWQEYERRIAKGQFDIVLGGWQLSNIPDLRFIFHSSRIGSTNFIGYNNSDMDKLLNEAAFIKNDQLKKEKYKEIQHLVVDDLPYFSLYFKNSSVIMKKYVKGNIIPKPNRIYNNIENWYVIDEK
ncbi:peptide ABC transporter substrate-binding protein [Crassaminicella profunda]|uniref:peptide ABC transporter substrate-binding protein n=1 Tax=Crassaminicella profunda TaxID=1286698 RepID=UPI001CA62142|nr:peptide ABC transporter substrate-binding protein [Crassaminicella profunda]QZY56582.1 peptide ABC transporter substrate-binding protein [Crassaminicella profunda]